MRQSNPSPADVKPLTAAAIVDRLVEIRDELANGVKPAFVVPSIWSLIGDIERTADAATEAAMDAMRDRLAATVPPVAGGSPIADEWPAEFDPELDGVFWITEAVPVEVLAASEPFGDSDTQWGERLAAAVDAANRWSEIDAMIAFGC
ncbi:hypothetical protein [Paludisphaera mucosa]|uniref:Uncharacterized protein n=1 Tax=Paludisphaera mucosa TaxID=3030827 RepID=A0ABT6FLQ2_9BACT|nr:hypothetical protein [Paludisphaera mucosa]MDG3008511.1 hypothetical protein [Paludisphaera mucosa]